MYSVSTLFHTSPVANPEEHFSWEDRVLLFFAESPEEAQEKAEVFARQQELEYENALGEMVAVKFERVQSVCAIDDALTIGCELFYRFLTESEARSILQKFDH